MDTRTKDIGEQVKQTAQDLSARAKTAGTAAWEKAKMSYQSAQEQAVAKAQAADRTIRTNPYQSIGIAFGVGLLLGFLIKRRQD
jgi:ElaB/YqjD/DUF883 family membrane-anchored ribosome-binding protein